jgi:glycosyltransferase involved in cell wall biosynthesis
METWIALMGKRNTPTDGVEDYCAFLATALAARSVQLEPVHVEWSEKGWKPALAALAQRSESWRGRWVLLQYTALAWSSRGFPLGALKAMEAARQQGARVAVVYHEFAPQEAGHFLVRPLRRALQAFVIRRLYRMTDLAVFTVPPSKISWLPERREKAAFIPIGANIPEAAADIPQDTSGERTVAVFCFTPSPNQELEIADIVHAMKAAHREGGATHLAILGRGSEEVRPEIERRLAGGGIRVTASGLLPAREISRQLARADALLFVSGQVSQTRGSALAGIACGLPVVGYAGAAEGTAIAEAGLRLAPYRNREALGEALASVMRDANLRADLRRRSREAQQQHFSWDAIASQYAAACARDAVSEAATGETRRSSLQSPGIS